MAWRIFAVLAFFNFQLAAGNSLLENLTETSINDEIEIEMFFSLLKMDFHRTKTEIRKGSLFKKYARKNR